VTALLAEVEQKGERLAEELATRRRRRAVSLVGAAGAGKAAAMRHAKSLMGEDAILLEATDDDGAPIAALDTLVAGLEGAGQVVGAVRDADESIWSERLRRCEAALERRGEHSPAVLVSGLDLLERRARAGGAPGRHAAQLTTLLRQSVPRLGASRATMDARDDSVVRMELSDLRSWLRDPAQWGELATVAAQVGDAGAPWSTLPALTLRVLVGLAHLGALPPTPPSTPLEAARRLADALAAWRSARPVWASWQLLAAFRGPLDQVAVATLLDEPYTASVEDALVRCCLLFPHDGWRMHPALRHVADSPPPRAYERMLHEHQYCEVGRKMAAHFRREWQDLVARGRVQAAAAACAAAFDAAAMAGERGLLAGMDDGLPDPYDHLGGRLALNPRLVVLC
jgi:hypothetical protein